MPKRQREKKNLSRIEGESKIILNICQEPEECFKKRFWYQIEAKEGNEEEYVLKYFHLLGYLPSS